MQRSSSTYIETISPSLRHAASVYRHWTSFLKVGVHRSNPQCRDVERSLRGRVVRLVHAHLCRFPYSHPLGSTVVTQTPIDCRVTIDLREHRFGRSGRVVASCAFDLSSTTDQGEFAHVYVKRGPRSCTVPIPQTYPSI
jgi:hypothetical protein